MSFANKYNTTGSPFAGIGADLPYTSRKEIFERAGEGVFPVKGIFINPNGEYGDSPNIISKNFLVSAPKHLLETFKDILADGESISLIRNGLVGFSVYRYINKKEKECYGIRWHDIKIVDANFEESKPKPKKPESNPIDLDDLNDVIPF